LNGVRALRPELLQRRREAGLAEHGPNRVTRVHRQEAILERKTADSLEGATVFGYGRMVDGKSLQAVTEHELLFRNAVQCSAVEGRQDDTLGLVQRFER
jgi:hypothetical protein